MSHFAAVSDVVYGKVASWRGAPDVTVVASMAGLSNRPSFDVRGVHSSTGVVIVADTQPIHRAISTLHHEVVAHHGLRAVLGTKWAGFMSAVLDATHAGDKSLLLAREMVRETYTDEHGNPNLSLVSEADEMAAAVTEWNTNFSTGKLEIVDPIRKQAKAVAGHLAREVLLLDVPAYRDQIDGAILLAHHHVKHGGLMFGFWHRALCWYDPAMSKPTGAKNPPRSVAESEDMLRAADNEKFFLEWIWDFIRPWLKFGAFLLAVTVPSWIAILVYQFSHGLGVILMIFLVALYIYIIGRLE